jgi:hypothetical protein
MVKPSNISDLFVDSGSKPFDNLVPAAAAAAIADFKVN